MNTPSEQSDAMREVILNPTNGIVGVVDGVLGLCRKFRLQLDWRGNECRLRRDDGDKEEVIELTLRKSVFRAILARVAFLCSEKTPGSFSPYGGQGTLSIGPDSAATLRVAWVNTLAEQRLELLAAEAAKEEPFSVG
jgi:hypothetical protein